MTDLPDTFLKRRRLRDESRTLTQQIIFGYVIGGILTLVGAYNYYLSLYTIDALWQGIMCLGLLAVGVTLLAPWAWRLPEKALAKVGNFVGEWLMRALLTIIYFLAISPVGYLLRALRGTAPIYAWDHHPPANPEGWHTKVLPVGLVRASDNAKRRGRIGMLQVFMFFVRGGHYMFLPVLIVLVALGMALFFLKTSALAPLVYTLF